MNKVVLSSSLLLFIAASQFAYADKLTLSAATQLLIQHPQWQLAQAMIEQAESEVLVANQYQNPSIEFLSEGQNTQSMTLSLPLETPNVRRYRQLGADYALSQTTQQALFIQRQLQSQLKSQYYHALEKMQAKQLADEELNLLDKLRHVVQLKVAVGESPRYESVKAEAEWLASQAISNTAAQQLTQAQQQLASFLGIEQVMATNLSLPSDQFLCQVAQLPVETHLEYYSPYQAAKAHVAKTGAMVDYERALVVPQPTVSLGQERESGVDRIKLGVSLPLPLFHQRDGEIAAAKAKQQQSVAQLHDVERQFQLNWSQALLRYQSAQAQLASYEAGLLNEAKSAFQVAQTAYTYGERSILDLIDAQRTLASVKKDYLNFQFEQRYACIEMQQMANAWENTDAE